MKRRVDQTSLARSFGQSAGRSLQWAAGLSALAGLLHASFAPEHFEEWFGYGAFFVIVAAAQLTFSVMLLSRRPARALLFAGVAGNILIMALYLFTRTHGIPLGPHVGEIESIGALDALTAIDEMALIADLVWLLQNRRWFEEKATHGAAA